MIDDFISWEMLKTYIQNGSVETLAPLFVISLTSALPTHGNNSNFHVDSMETTCPMLYPSLANGCQARMPPMLLADVK